MSANYDYWVTFRVKQDATGDERRAALVEAAKAIKKGRWMEPTSFILMASEKTASQLATYLSTGLDASKDILLVCDVNNAADAAYFGAVERSDVLLQFLPQAKNV